MSIIVKPCFAKVADLFIDRTMSYRENADVLGPTFGTLMVVIVDLRSRECICQAKGCFGPRPLLRSLSLYDFEVESQLSLIQRLVGQTSWIRM